jgi:DNA-binding transcriptional LysR family regulator
VVHQARRALQACDEVERTARRIAVGAELTVVATPTNSTLLSPIVTSFVREHPTTALRLRRAASVEDIIEIVGAGEAELGFGDLWEGLEENGLVAYPIWSAEVVIVSPVGTELPPVVRMEELAGSRLVLPLAGTKRRQMLDYVLMDAFGSAPLPTLASDERSAWVTSAQQGIGSFLSYKTVAHDLDDVEVRPLNPRKWVEVGFRYRPAYLSEGGRAMVRLAAECPVPEGCRPASSPGTRSRIE